LSTRTCRLFYVSASVRGMVASFDQSYSRRRDVYVGLFRRIVPGRWRPLWSNRIPSGAERARRGERRPSDAFRSPRVQRRVTSAPKQHSFFHFHCSVSRSVQTPITQRSTIRVYLELLVESMLLTSVNRHPYNRMHIYIRFAQ